MQITPIRWFVLACCLGTSANTPARAADHINGDWFIISGKAKLSTSIAGHSLLKDSAPWVKDGAEVRVLALPADSAFLVRLTNGAWWGINLPGSLWDKNVELSKGHRNIESVALMAQGGWALLYDRGNLATNGVPQAIRTQLQSAVNDMKKAGKNSRPNFVAFAPDGGWVLLGDKDYREHGLPRELSESLAEHKQRGIAIRCVAFDCRGDWFMVDARNNCFTSNPKHAAVAKIKSLQSAGEAVRLIVFTPGVYRHGYVLEQRPVRRIEATMTMSFRVPQGKVDRWAVIPPVFPELPRQRGVKLTYEPAATPVQDEGMLKQKVHIIRVADKPTGFEAKVRCELTLYANRLRPLLAGQARPKAALPAAEAKTWTPITEDMKTKLFTDFLANNKLRRGPKESDLDFARRTILVIAKQFTYISPIIEGKDVVECRKGDCSGLSWVFVRVMRANQVPTRLLLGHWANSETPGKNGEDPDTQTHVKAEFFAAGIGWVAVDQAIGVANAAGNPLTCLGNEAGDFIVADLDIERLVSNFANDPPAKLGGIQNYFWWYQGSGENIRVDYHWLVKTLDAPR